MWAGTCFPSLPLLTPDGVVCLWNHAASQSTLPNTTHAPACPCGSAMRNLREAARQCLSEHYVTTCFPPPRHGAHRPSSPRYQWPGGGRRHLGLRRLCPTAGRLGCSRCGPVRCHSGVMRCHGMLGPLVMGSRVAGESGGCLASSAMWDSCREVEVAGHGQHLGRHWGRRIRPVFLPVGGQPSSTRAQHNTGRADFLALLQARCDSLAKEHAGESVLPLPFAEIQHETVLYCVRGLLAVDT